MTRAEQIFRHKISDCGPYLRRIEAQDNGCTFYSAEWLDYIIDTFCSAVESVSGSLPRITTLSFVGVDEIIGVYSFAWIEDSYPCNYIAILREAN